MKTLRAIGSINYRAVGDGMPKEFGGIAAVVDVTTDLKYFEERILKGAFDNALKKDYDIPLGNYCRSRFPKLWLHHAVFHSRFWSWVRAGHCVSQHSLWSRFTFA